MQTTAQTYDDAQTKLFRKDALRARINEMTNVSTVPVVLKQIMELTGNPNTVIHDLVAAIERDQAIAMKVVAASNAAFYGFSKKINTVSQAILVLGFDMVKGLAITTTVFNSVPGGGKERLLSLWAHSFEVAQAAILVARKTGLIAPEPAFFAGLLHDLGHPILFHACGAGTGKDPFENNSIEEEEEAFGASHSEAGAWFAERFHLPEECANAIRYHHSPEESGRPEELAPLVAITYLANIAVTGKEKAVISPDHDAIMAVLKLTDEDLEAIAGEIGGQRESTNSFYS